jgi:hypothetical protein
MGSGVAHWRIIEQGLEFLAHQLLDEHEPPGLELEPIEILLPAPFVPLFGQPRRSNGSRRKLITWGTST